MKNSISPASFPMLVSQVRGLLLVTLLYAFTNGDTSLTALTVSELTAATLASIGLFFSPLNGLFFTAAAKFSKALAQFLTVKRCNEMHKFDASDVVPVDADATVDDPPPKLVAAVVGRFLSNKECAFVEAEAISQSLARDGPSIRTPSKILKLAAAADAATPTAGTFDASFADAESPSSKPLVDSGNVSALDDFELDNPPPLLRDMEDLLLLIPASFMKNSSMMSSTRSTTRAHTCE
mmetsp:Transcript_6485/g.8208  ORF Transcript_6485/g.8208 Transcript_6485/m.8208 type:complete len:237 (-) Transcript_6485:492-1202(-)